MSSGDRATQPAGSCLRIRRDIVRLPVFPSLLAIQDERYSVRDTRPDNLPFVAPKPFSQQEVIRQSGRSGYPAGRYANGTRRHIGHLE